MNITISCSAICAALIGTTGLAANNTNDVTPAVSLLTGFADISLRDHYLSYRTERSVNRTPVVWSELNIGLTNGEYVAVFDSKSLSPAGAEQKADELDLVVGKRGHIFGIDYDASVRYMNFHPIGVWGGSDCFDAGLLVLGRAWEHRHHSLRPALDLEWLAPVAHIDAGGPLVQPGLVYAWKQAFGLKRLSIVDRNWLAWDDISFFKNSQPDGFFYRNDAALVWRLSNRLNLSLPAVRVIAPVMRPSDGRKADFQFWGGLRWNF